MSPADDETKLGPSAPASSSSGGHVTSSSGWLSTSDAIDHGRFPPGTLLGGRYRIVGRAGKGGMGEVYRADDLKLGQSVALKFLTPEVDRDPARLMQLHSEVRMARQVSHPNVCRVYDIDEVDGHTFLSMEFVDGEELGSLLRRIGRFSVERSLELARQMSAGLAAAHERGVVHRDLKPANVMIDESGKVRITDFGLAGVAGASLRAGTPAYMAPEQLAGQQITPQSDIYALGLVLYELFTGHRAIEAKNVSELLRKREEGIIPPSQLVRDLDPAIDRAILRCLEHDPADRPSSALGVAAALPGGDPLAAALAAGETPSPEMVAASGGTSALGAVPAVSALVSTLALLVAFMVMSERALLTSYVPLQKPPEVLADRAQEVMHTLGYPDQPVDSAWGFYAANDFLRFARRNSDGPSTQNRLRAGRPAGLLFWYRSSPRQMVPVGTEERVSLSNPPFTITDMRTVTLDTTGRLVEFDSVPPEMDAITGGTPPSPNWQALFELAALPFGDFKPTAPQWTPRTYSTERAAWEGPLPGWPDQRLRVEAGAYKGRPVFFQLIYPWTEPARMRETPPSRAEFWGQTIVSLVFLTVLGVAALVARHHIRKGRGDRRGTFRISAVVFFTTLVSWLANSTHFATVNPELGRFFTAVGEGLFNAGLLCLLYLALEPYVRRFWPVTLVSWSRFIAGQFVDPRVGRDVLIGTLFGIAIVLAGLVHQQLRTMLGAAYMPQNVPVVVWLEGFRRMVAAVTDLAFSAMVNSLWIVFGLVVTNLLVRRIWITAVVMVAFLLVTTVSDITQQAPIWLSFIFALIVVSSMVFVLLRFGLLAAIVMFFVNFALGNAVVTLDPSKWFFPTSATLLMFVAALAVYGFYSSRAGEPLLGRRIFD
jgi:serine/threonine-protein kinase